MPRRSDGTVQAMLVLGLSGNFSEEETDLVPGMREYFFHDASASIVRDGELVAAVEEERFNRIKKTTKFPAHAVRACLRLAGVGPAEVDAVGFYFPEETVDLTLNYLYTDHSSVPLRYSRGLLRDRLREELDWDLSDDRLHYTPHHLAHALSTYVHSGMAEALVLVLDAAGDTSSGTVYHAADGELRELHTYSIPDSLGRFYLSATQQIGYGFGDEYKLMGLAPYGDPAVYDDVFSSLYTLRERGEYAFVPGDTGLGGVGPAMFVRGDPPRRAGDRFTQRHRDFAAGVQATLEAIVLHVVRHWQQATGLRRLCFGGGVAHNSSLNGALLRSGLFEEIFVHPASHDAGAGEGAAFVVERRLNGIRRAPKRLRSASVGPDLGSAVDIGATLDAWGALVEVERPDDIVDRAAQLLADGAVLGWAHGRSEFGPRALGNRSIVADPRPPSNQTRINAMIKNRESYRPFAPAVTAEAADAYFDLSPTRAHHDFMSFVVPVRPERRAELGAVTHVDGTARVQVVDPDGNARFHRLVHRFGQLTGTPVLLNTSFNNNAEPIVQTVEDALTTFLTTDLDHLVVEDLLVHRRPREPHALDDYVLRLRPTTRLTHTVRHMPSGQRHEAATIHLDYSTGTRTELSPQMHALLARVDGRTIGALRGTAEDLPPAFYDELYALWRLRYFELVPVAAPTGPGGDRDGASAPPAADPQPAGQGAR